MASRILFKKISVAKGASVFTATGFTAAGVMDIVSNPARSDIGIANQPIARGIYSGSNSYPIVDSINDGNDISRNNKNIRSGAVDNPVGTGTELHIIRNQLEKAPITYLEAECAISTLIERPGVLEPIIDSVLPRHVEVDIQRVFSAVRQIVTDQEIVCTTLSKIEANKNDTAQRMTCAITAAPSSSSNPNWDRLAEKYCCSLCRDVFAVPHILECKHTFCWDCLHQHLSTCSSEDPNIPVVHNCPECRCPITDEATHELRYDEIICNEVESFPDCEEKHNWKEKRLRFETHRDSDTQLNEDHSVDEAEEEDWNLILQYVVPIVAFVTICIIIKSRN